MNPILPDRLDWPSAIGNFIINFGMLDWQIFAFLESRMPPDEFAQIKTDHLQDRVERVKTLVNEGPYSDEQKRAFANFFTRLEPIRELRNHIAHGHMLLRQEAPGKTPVLTLSLPKNLDATFAPESRHLELKELIAKLTELTELIEEFGKMSDLWSEEQEIRVNL